MKFIVLVCLALLVTANDYELLSELSQYEFGKTIIATMQISLSSEDSNIDGIVHQLKSMQTNAQSDLEENTQNLRHQQELCNLRFDEIQGVIDSASAKKASDEQLFPLRQEELIAKNQQLKDKVGQDQRIQDRLSSLEKSREEEKKAFEAKQTESVEFIQGLKKAKSIVSQLNSSFIQVADVKAKLHKHLESLHNKQTPYNGLVKMLVAASGDENVSKVVQIIDELIESLEHLQKVGHQGEKAKQELYLLQKARYELESKTLETSLADLSANAENLRQNLLELKHDIESKGQLLDVKTQEMADWQKTCADELKAHQNVRQSKNTELGIINECIEIFTSRFNDGIKSYIQKLEI
ncbi:unnamed protein product [Paramecium primaurelia]|uniref:Trichocyst matrix protein n=1 Tax=Paramecium primaurelia TaxID=5886 RepID=A0A8S1MW31_PARPR|nr:unnamed protein product [Paramecium primaurelia]